MVEKAASVQRNTLKDLQKAGELFLKATLKKLLGSLTAWNQNKEVMVAQDFCAVLY